MWGSRFFVEAEEGPEGGMPVREAPNEPTAATSGKVAGGAGHARTLAEDIIHVIEQHGQLAITQ